MHHTIVCLFETDTDYMHMETHSRANENLQGRGLRTLATVISHSASDAGFPIYEVGAW